MTFAEYWRENEPFGSNPEDVAELAWNAAIEQCVAIAEKYQGCLGCAEDIAANIRAGATKSEQNSKGEKA